MGDQERQGQNSPRELGDFFTKKKGKAKLKTAAKPVIASPLEAVDHPAEDHDSDVEPARPRPSRSPSPSAWEAEVEELAVAITSNADWHKLRVLPRFQELQQRLGSDGADAHCDDIFEQIRVLKDREETELCRATAEDRVGGGEGEGSACSRADADSRYTRNMARGLRQINGARSLGGLAADFLSRQSVAPIAAPKAKRKQHSKVHIQAAELESKNDRELRAFCVKHDIALHGCATREGLLDKIRNSDRVQVAEPPREEPVLQPTSPDSDWDLAVKTPDLHYA